VDVRWALVLRAVAVSTLLCGAVDLAHGSAENPWGQGQGGATLGFKEPGEQSADVSEPAEARPRDQDQHNAAASALEKSTAEIDAANKERDRRSIRIGGRRVFEFLAPFGSQTPEARAEVAGRTLRLAVEHPAVEAVQVKQVGGDTALLAAEIELFRLGPRDAELAHAPSLREHATEVAENLTETIRAEKKRRKIATTIFAVSLAALLALMALLLMRKTGELAQRAHTWVEKHRDRFGGISFQSTEVVSRSTVQNAVLISVELSKWLARATILYFWILFTLLLFEGSRVHAKLLTGFVFSPVYQLTSRIASSLPLLVVAFLAVGVLAVLLRFIDLFFLGVVRGETSVAWLSPELARPTSMVLRVGLCVGALLFVAPIVTGDDNGALHEVALVLLLALGLALVPLLSSAMVGFFVVFGRRLRPGDFVEFGGSMGRVIQVGLLETRLEVEDGTELRIPQILSLWNRTHLLGPRPRVSVEVVLSEISEEMCEELRKRAQRLGDRPLVEILTVRPGAVGIRVSVTSARIDAKNALSLTLLEFMKSI
jgi:small-conductance mechanosensitive channel